MESPPIGLPLRTPLFWGNLSNIFSEQLGCNIKNQTPQKDYNV